MKKEILEKIQGTSIFIALMSVIFAIFTYCVGFPFLSRFTVSEGASLLVIIFFICYYINLIAQRQIDRINER